MMCQNQSTSHLEYSMKTFPTEFSDLLSPRGKRVLMGNSPAQCGLFTRSNLYFANLTSLIGRESAEACIRILDESLYETLHIEQRRIPPESITEMKENYSEILNKTMHIKTAFFRKKSARSYRAAEKVGLLRMMRSESFILFAEAATGLKLDRDYGIQVSCYEHGD